MGSAGDPGRRRVCLIVREGGENLLFLSLQPRSFCSDGFALTLTLCVALGLHRPGVDSDPVCAVLDVAARCIWAARLGCRAYWIRHPGPSLLLLSSMSLNRGRASTVEKTLRPAGCPEVGRSVDGSQRRVARIQNEPSPLLTFSQPPKAC